jgi:hypothetical protein
MARIYAGTLGLLAFATIAARGLAHAGAADGTIRQAVAMLFVFAVLGYAIGRIAQWIIDDSVRGRLALGIQNKQANTSTRKQAVEHAAA